MYNTPDKHNTSHIGRSKFDFSDIDNLDRATEAFMKEQRKALGHRTVNLDAIAEQGKRALVFVVLGAVFVTALVAGLRFGISDDALRDPNTSVSDSMVESGTNQTTNGSSNNQSKDDANGAATTAPEHEAQSSVTTDPTTYQDDPALSTTLPQLTDSDVVIFTTTTTTTAHGEGVTTPVGTSTQKTTTQKSTTTSKSTATSKTTTKSSVTSTSTTLRSSTTTTTTTSTTRKTSTTTTTPKTTTTTTTTTTTAAPKAEMAVTRVRFVSCQSESGGTYRTVLQVYVQNNGNAAASGATVNITTSPISQCSYAGSTTDGWYANTSRGNAYVTTYDSIAPGESAVINVYLITNVPLLQCSATC